MRSHKHAFVCDICESTYGTLRTLVLHVAGTHVESSPRAPGYAEAWTKLQEAALRASGWGTVVEGPGDPPMALRGRYGPL